MKLPKFTEVRKLAAVVLGFTAEAVASGLLSGTLEHVAQGILAAATAVGVYAVPNAGKVGARVGSITGYLHLDNATPVTPPTPPPAP